MILSIFKGLKTFIAWFDFVALSAVMYILSWLPHKLTSSFYPKLFQYWCWVFIRALGVQLYCHEKHTRPIPKQFILIGNHPSAFEDIGMPALFKARFLAKIEVKDWWIVGRMGRAARTLFVDRRCKTSRSHSVKALENALNDGDNVALYPEGGCKGRRINLPFRYGIFEISMRTKVPILPVFLHYEAQSRFEWAKETLVQKLWTIFKTQNKRVNYYIHDPIRPEAFNSKEEYCQHVEALYLKWQAQYLD